MPPGKKDGSDHSNGEPTQGRIFYGAGNDIARGKPGSVLIKVDAVTRLVAEELRVACHRYSR